MKVSAKPPDRIVLELSDCGDRIRGRFARWIRKIQAAEDWTGSASCQPGSDRFVVS